MEKKPVYTSPYELDGRIPLGQAIPLGLLPVLLYGWLYLDRVVVTKTWRDMYGFNKNGRWKLSFSLLVLGTVAIAVLLWWL